MKKILLSILSLFFSYLVVAQKPDYELNEAWEDTAWVPIFRTNYTYDANSFLIEGISQLWDSNIDMWLNAAQNIYTYNANGLITENVTKSWTESTQTWDEGSKYIYTYTTNNKVDTTLYMIFANNAWENGERIKTVYNTNDLKMSELSDKWEANAWKIFGRIDYQYDSLNREVQSISQYWVEDSLSLINNERITRTYSPADTQQVILTEFWVDNSWKNAMRSTSNYDATGFCMSTVFEMWDDGPMAWKNASYHEYSKNSAGKLYQKIVKSWDEQTGMWKDLLRYTEVYPTTTGIATINERMFKMAPNPVTDKLHISLPDHTPTIVSVINLQGKVLYMMNATRSETDVDVSALPAGMYMLQVVCGKEMSVKKFIKNE